MQQPLGAVEDVAIFGEHKDGNKLGVSVGTIFGLKKSVFNSTDYATVVMSSYAIAH